MPSLPRDRAPHQIPADPPRAWELAYRPDLTDPTPWQILHPLTCDPPYCDVQGPAHLQIYYAVDDELRRHYVWLPYPGAWRVRPVDRVLEPLADPPRPRALCDLWTLVIEKGPFDPMTTADPDSPRTAGTVVTSLAVSEAGQFWKKIELTMPTGATEAEIAAALAQADYTHAAIERQLYAPAPAPALPAVETAAPAPADDWLADPAALVALPVAAPRAAAPISAAPPARAGTPASPSNGADATAKQIAAIYAIARNTRRWVEAQVEGECEKQFGGRHPNDLTKSEASTFIDFIKGEVAA